ncbi:MAG: hypothetical protein AMXMBFR84_34560 [Candidatus Hydrogenedentota bacterium]
MKRLCVLLALALLVPLVMAEPVDVDKLLGEQWYGVYMNGKKSGYGTRTLKKDEQENVFVESDVHFQISMNSIKQDMRIFSSQKFDPQGQLVEINSVLHDQAGDTQFKGVMTGTEMLFSATVAGQTIQERLPRPKETLDDVLRTVELVQGNAKVGDKLSYTSYDLVLKTEVNATCEIVGIEERLAGGVPVRVFKIRSIDDVMNLEQTTYITAEGVVLEDVVAQIMTMRLEPMEVAKDVDYSNDTVVSNAAFVDDPIQNPREREILTLRIMGPLLQEHLFQDDRQQFTPDGDSYMFTAKRVSMDGVDAPDLPISDTSVAEWLTPTTFVQSDNPSIINKAREIVGDEKDSYAAARKICDWVSDNLRSTFSARMTNAAEVLESLEGDCTEHSVLFIALARAAGIPAREVAGLIYMDNGSEPGFYFHQWAKVWAGKWIDMDPTWDQPLVDATHIKLAEGDIRDQLKIIPLIGQIRIVVVEEGTPR